VDINSDCASHKWRDVSSFVVSLVLAAPSVLLVFFGRFGSIHFRIENFVFYRSLLVALILLAGALIVWSLKRSRGSWRVAQMFIFVLHILSFAVLIYWFGRWHS